MTIEPVSLESPEPDEKGSATDVSRRMDALPSTGAASPSWLRLALPLAALVIGLAIYAALVATSEEPVT